MTKYFNAFALISAELDVLDILFSGITQIEDEEELFEYIQGCRDIVMNADISEESKEVIRVGLSVALGSKILWKESDELIEE